MSRAEILHDKPVHCRNRIMCIPPQFISTDIVTWLSAPPLASQNGDVISIDVNQRVMDMKVSEEELAKRKAAWKAPALKATSGTLYKYIKLVASASEGCVTDA